MPDFPNHWKQWMPPFQLQITASSKFKTFSYPRKSTLSSVEIALKALTIPETVFPYIATVILRLQLMRKNEIFYFYFLLALKNASTHI
jgi:hypothetical protein